MGLQSMVDAEEFKTKLLDELFDFLEEEIDNKKEDIQLEQMSSCKANLKAQLKVIREVQDYINKIR